MFKIGLMVEGLLRWFLNPICAGSSPAKATRYFITFYHYYANGVIVAGYLKTFNDEGNFVNKEFIINHLNSNKLDKLSEINIIETVEVSKKEFDRIIS